VRQAGGLLVAAGHANGQYVEGMLAREAVAPTYLGNGVAMPHGMHADRRNVLSTGIAVLQYPEGVPWDGGDEARLVIALATAEPEGHLTVMQNLARLLDDATQLGELMSTRDRQLVVRQLTAALETG
jgi:phosphocarrier protein FPr